MPRDAYVMLLDGIPGAPLPLPQRTRGFYATASTQERLSRAYQEAMTPPGLSGVGVFADLSDAAEDRRRAMAIATSAKNTCRSLCNAAHPTTTTRDQREAKTRCLAGCDAAYNVAVGAIEAGYPAGTSTTPSEDVQRRIDQLLAEQERRNEDIRREKEEQSGSGGGTDNQQMLMWGLLGVGGLVAVALLLRS